jgi:hypothetical protein
MMSWLQTVLFLFLGTKRPCLSNIHSEPLRYSKVDEDTSLRNCNALKISNIKLHLIKACGECPLLPIRFLSFEAEREPTGQFADPALAHLAQGVGQ